MPILDMLRRKKGPGLADDRSPADVLKATVGSLNNLPTLPEAATRAMAVANDPNSALGDFAEVIKRDPALAAGILKLANSPLYRIGRAIESLDQAVLRLGLRECQNLIVAVGMRSLFRNITAGKRQQCETLWRHSFLAACLCRHINRAAGLGFRGEEFSCGLSHDIGRVLIAIGVPNHFDTADPMDFIEGPDTLTHEQEVLGTDHCFFGAWFANHNQLPSSLISAIQYHHDPSEATEHTDLVGLVATADHVANHLQRESDTMGYDVSTNPGWAFLSSRIPAEKVQLFHEAFGDIVAAVVQEADEVVSLSTR
jgi:HD-like signal output (HDOD) protein